MSCNILLAVDESKNSSKAIDWVRKNINKDASVTLLSILPDATSACGMDSPSLSPLFKENSQTFCGLEDAKRARVREFTADARAKLVRAGFDSGKVVIRVRKKKSGIARDILKESKTGKYDTLVIGRHGLTGIKGFFFGSIANKIVQLAVGITVIVAD